MADNYILRESWGKPNIQEREYVAHNEAEKDAMLVRGGIVVGDKVYVIASKKTYMLGFDNKWYDATTEGGGGGDVSGKADKVVGAVEGNLPALDSTGNLMDSGIAAEDVGVSMVEKTYAELVGLKSQNQLVPGTKYRITDFVTKINGTYHEDESSIYIHYARSAEHPFDIIVLAISENTLSENATAIQHSGDTYFVNNNLAAWEIKYTIENDASRFLWADETSGKGVIYYMKDEFNNEAWYDFKNVQFLMYGLGSSNECISYEHTDYRASYGTAAPLFESLWAQERSDFPIYWGDEERVEFAYDLDSAKYYEAITPEFIELYHIQYAYTFNRINQGAYPNPDYPTDASLNINTSNGSRLYNCINNSIGRAKGSKYLYDKSYGDVDSTYMLNMCVFRQIIQKVHDNKIGNNCLGIVFGDDCSYNTIGDDCSTCLILRNGNYNKIGKSCYNIFICYDNEGNTINNNCNTILIDLNTNGYSKSSNTFADNSTGYLGKYCTGNTIGNNSSVYLYSGYCQNNIISDYVQAEVYINSDEYEYGYFQGNKIYGNVYISCGTDCRDNTFYNMSVNLGNNCSNNTFVGPNENDVSLGDNCSDIYIGSYCEGIIIGDSCSNIFINNWTSFFSLPANSYNYNILTGSYSYAEIPQSLSSDTTNFVGLDSNGNVKTWNPADLVQ